MNRPDSSSPARRRWLREADAVHTVCEVFPLERTADAHRRVESGTKRGTVVVTP